MEFCKFGSLYIILIKKGPKALMGKGVFGEVFVSGPYG